MKKRLLLALSLVLAFSMMFAACGNAPASTDSGSAPDASAPPANPGEVYEVIASFSHGEPVSPNWVKALKELEDRSGGRFKVTTYWSGSLIPIPEVPKGMSTGAATFVNLPTNNYPDIMPLNARILQLPFMGLQDPIVSAEIYMQLLDEFPEMKQELTDYNMIPLGATPLGMYGMHFTDKNEVRLPEDLKGRKVVPYSLPFLPMLEANNAAGSYIPPGQIYESLEKGVVNGYINSWAFQGWFGLTDLVNQHVNFGEYGAFQEFNILVINADFYNSLPEDLQQLWQDIIWNEGGYKAFWEDTADLYYGEVEKGEAKGDLIVNLTPEEIAVWRDAVLPEHQVVLDEIAAQRGDSIGNDIYDRIKELVVEKYGA
jgi:TRAP-type C4-dicarboxylate transport system substrate-binding protein